jgi:primosomal protein N' (replication factor Y)
MALIAKVVPLCKLKRGLDAFDYNIPDTLAQAVRSGSLVSINFRNRLISGIVTEVVSASEFSKIKDLSGVLSSHSLVSPECLQFAKWFSNYYYYSLASILKQLWPISPLKKHRRKASTDKTIVAQTRPTVDRTIAIANQIMTGKQKDYVILAYDQNLNAQLLMRLITEPVNGQILLLFPQVEKAQSFFNQLAPSLKSQAALVNSDQAKGKNQRYEVWSKIASGEIRVIVGTRSAVLLPFAKLALIVMDQAHSDDFKSWDQTPRFHTLDAVRKWQELFNSIVVYSSVCPRPEDYYQTAKRGAKLITLGKNSTAIRVIETRDAAAYNELLSPDILDAINSRLASNHRVMLVANSRGEGGAQYCRDCETIPRCPTCAATLTVLEDSLTCFYCQPRKSFPLTCPKCHGFNLSVIGIGQSQLKKYLHAKFPDYLLSETEDTIADIYIMNSTRSRVTAECQLFVLLNIDRILYRPDYQMNYKAYQTVMDLAAMAGRPAEIIVQTGMIENVAIASLTKDYQSFYQQDLQARQLFGYPPFGLLIKLFNSASEPKLARIEAEELFQKLQSAVKGNDLEIMPPYCPPRLHVRGGYRYNILLKFKQKNDILERQILSLIDDSWTIDKNPINIV